MMKKNKPKRILVIEDDYEIRTTVSDVLENYGFEVYTVGDGVGGVKLALELNPDLILCDIMMPGKNGHQVLAEISENADQQIPFIYLTAKSELKDIRKGMQLGADDYIVKPFRAKDLINAIESRLERIEGFRNPTHDQDDSDSSEKLTLSEDQSIFLQDLKEARFVKVCNIELIKSFGDLTIIYLKDCTKFNTRKSMSHWEQVLPKDTFYRTHRAFIVNSNYIESIEPWFKRSYRISMKGLSENVFISERYAVKLKKLLP